MFAVKVNVRGIWQHLAVFNALLKVVGALPCWSVFSLAMWLIVEC